MTHLSKTTEGQELLLCRRWSWDNNPEITPQTPSSQSCTPHITSLPKGPRCVPEPAHTLLRGYCHSIHLCLLGLRVSSPKVFLQQTRTYLWPHKDGHRQFINGTSTAVFHKSSLENRQVACKCTFAASRFLLHLSFISGLF